MLALADTRSGGGWTFHAPATLRPTWPTLVPLPPAAAGGKGRELVPDTAAVERRRRRARDVRGVDPSEGGRAGARGSANAYDYGFADPVNQLDLDGRMPFVKNITRLAK
ncbi:hypothetical protein [Kitasatospora purpeofusca]|uniref:hypothetical protein n=1 Tax=Kitasatospora purpeofusca TaxID=67352 RepID=UPI002A5AF4CB|nr:hypothetical protein [Kitasatospora purpeofusca]MDY0813536.1 hypothetical protein [Kitasatospora purpeofusca]